LAKVEIFTTAGDEPFVFDMKRNVALLIDNWSCGKGADHFHFDHMQKHWIFKRTNVVAVCIDYEADANA